MRYLLISIFIVWGCSKQEAPELAFDYTHDQSYMASCNKLDISTDVLHHEKVLILFECLRWNKKFPSLYASIKKIKTTDWNFIFSKFDQLFLSDKSKRNEFLKAFFNLDKKGGIDDLGNILSSLSASNFFDGSHRLLMCSKSAYDPACLKQKKYVLSREDLVKLVGFLKPEKNTVRDILISLKLLQNRFGPFTDDFVDSYRKILDSFDFHKSRELALNEVFKSMESGDIGKLKSILLRLLLSSEKDSDIAFIYNWPRFHATTADSFKHFLLMDKYGSTNLSLDFQAVHKILKRKQFECSGSQDGHSFKLKIKDVFDEYMMAIKNGDRDDYLKESIEKAVLVQLTSSTCPLLASSKVQVLRPYKGIFINSMHDFNLLRFLDVMNEVIGEHFEIVKFILTVLDIEGEDDLFNTLSHPATVSVLDLFKNINKISPEFLELVYKANLQFEYEEYIHLVNLIRKIDPKVGPLLSKAWRFFNEREKNFTMNFLDSHFKDVVEFSLLTDFYITLFEDNEDELNSLLSYFFKQENRNKTFNSFEKVSESFKGNSNLKDFKAFFSRDHILKVLQILTQGIPKELKLKTRRPPITGLDKAGFDGLIDSLEDYNLDLVFKKTTGTNRALLKCLKNITDQRIDFYDFSNRFKSFCTGVEKENFLFKIVIWLDTVSTDFRNLNGPRNNIFTANPDRVFRYPNGRQIGLFDEKGLLSPRLFQSWLSLFSVLEKKYGMKNLLLDIKEFIYVQEPELLNKIKELIDFLTEFELSTGEKFLNHRTSLIRELSRPQNYKRLNKFFSNIAALLKKYGQWVGSDQYYKILETKPEKIEEKLVCENFLINDHGHQPCISKKEAKESIHEFINLVLKKYDPSSTSALEFLIQGISPDHKIKIPVLGDAGSKYHFSLKDVLGTFYNLSDPSFSINNRYYPVIPPGTRNAYKYYKYYKKKKMNKIPKGFYKKFNSLERVEHILRNFGFDNNNILVGLANGTAHNVMGHEYLDKNLKKLELCTIMRYCGRFLNKNERIKSFNALMVSDVFYEIEEYENFKSGKTISAIVSASVVSSSPSAQKQRLIYFDKHLDQHNAELLYKMGKMSVGSHLARFIHDRIGRTRSDFEKFLERKEFILLNKYFLKNFPLKETQKAFSNIFREVIRPDKDNRKLLNILIDKISDSSYSDLRLFEDTMANLLSVAGYLGPLNQMIEFKGLHGKQYETLYKKNNLFPLLEASSQLLKYWPILYDFWPKNISGIKLVKNINAFLKFIKNNLAKNDRVTYEIINDLFLVLNKTLFDKQNGVRGIDLILPILDNEISIDRVMSFIDYFTNLFKRLNYKSDTLTGDRFISLSAKISFLTKSKEIDISPFRTYLESTTYKNICFDSNEDNCILNFHYDEPFSLLLYLGKERNLHNLFQILLKEDLDSLSKFSRKILSKISIRRIDE